MWWRWVSLRPWRAGFVASNSLTQRGSWSSWLVLHFWRRDLEKREGNSLLMVPSVSTWSWYSRTPIGLQDEWRAKVLLDLVVPKEDRFCLLKGPHICRQPSLHPVDTVSGKEAPANVELHPSVMLMTLACRESHFYSVVHKTTADSGVRRAGDREENFLYKTEKHEKIPKGEIHVTLVTQVSRPGVGGEGQEWGHIFFWDGSSSTCPSAIAAVL